MSSRMHIGLVLYRYFPWGGLQRDFLNIAKALLAKGHQLSIWCREWEGDLLDGANIHIVPVQGRSNHGRDRGFVEAFLQSDARKTVDCIVAFNRLPEADFYYAADPCYAEVYHQKHFLERMLPRPRQFLRYEQAMFNRQATTKILSISNIQKELFLKHYQLDEDRFIDLPPNVSRERQPTAEQLDNRQQFRKELNVEPNEKLLLLVGSNYQLKGVDRVLNAVASLPDTVRKNCRFAVIGKDKPEKMKQMALQLGVDKQTLFVGPTDEVMNWMLAADLLLHPARKENTGTVLVEAAVCGLPVIVSGVCGYAHYISDFDFGYVLAEPFSQEELNQKLLSALKRDNQDWKNNALSMQSKVDVFGMVDAAVAAIEQFSKNHESLPEEQNTSMGEGGLD